MNLQKEDDIMNSRVAEVRRCLKCGKELGRHEFETCGDCAFESVHGYHYANVLKRETE